jgi:hypothetical protein
LFFIFGIIALISKISVGWIFSLIGLGIIVVPILIRHPELLSFAVNWEFLAIFTFGLIFMIAGICLNIMLIYENENSIFLDYLSLYFVDLLAIDLEKEKIYPLYLVKGKTLV